MKYVIKSKDHTYLTRQAYREGIMRPYDSCETKSFDNKEAAENYIASLAFLKLEAIPDPEQVIFIEGYGYFTEMDYDPEQQALFQPLFKFTNNIEQAKIFDNKQKCFQMRWCIEFILGRIKKEE